MAENNNDNAILVQQAAAISEEKVNNTYLWKMLQPSGVSPLMKRRCHSAVIYGTSLYLFGGYVEETRCSSDLYVLDLIKREWRELVTCGESPSARAYHASCFVGRNMLIVGGASYSRVRNMEVHALNIDTLTWRQYPIAEGQAQPPVRCGHRVFALGKFFFMLGGSDDDTYYNDFWCFDTELGTWTEMFPGGNVPPPRNSFTMNLVGEDLYVFGGQVAGRTETDDFYKLNLPSLQWTKLFEYQRGRRRPRDEQGGEIEATAGNNAVTDTANTNNNNTTNTTNAADNNNSSTPMQIEVVNTEKAKDNRRRVVIPPPRADHAAITINKRIYMFGGFTGVYPNSTRYRDLYMFDTETEVWRVLNEQHGEVPFGMSGHTVNQYGNHMVLLGGFAGSYESINDNIYMLELPQSDMTLLELCIQTIREKQLYSWAGLNPSSAASQASAIQQQQQVCKMEEEEEEEDIKEMTKAMVTTAVAATAMSLSPASMYMVQLPLDLEEKLVF